MYFSLQRKITVALILVFIIINRVTTEHIRYYEVHNKGWVAVTMRRVLTFPITLTKPMIFCRNNFSKGIMRLGIYKKIYNCVEAVSNVSNHKRLRMQYEVFRACSARS